MTFTGKLACLPFLQTTDLSPIACIHTHDTAPFPLLIAAFIPSLYSLPDSSMNLSPLFPAIPDIEHHFVRVIQHHISKSH